MRILLVEDDDRFADALATALRRRGYDIERARSGHEALAAAPAELVLLDLGLPDMDGIEVLHRLRSASAIIVVTARGEEHQRVRGLRAGADDYLVKPFGIAELEARMEAVLRRVRVHRTDAADLVSLGPFSVDPVRRTVTRDGTDIALTRKELDLLLALARADGGVVSREELLARVWRTTWDGVERSLEVHVASLRSKLGEPKIIETVRGIGYRIKVP